MHFNEFYTVRSFLSPNDFDVSFFGEFIDRAFAKRPAEELYDIRTDPEQMYNVADLRDYQDTKKELSASLNRYLEKTKDPRVLGSDLIWDQVKYYATLDFKPKRNQKAIDLLHLKKEYNYFP